MSPEGSYQMRKQVLPWPVSFPLSSSFLLSSPIPLLPATFVDHLCARYCAGGGNVKIIKESLTSSY